MRPAARNQCIVIIVFPISINNLTAGRRHLNGLQAFAGFPRNLHLTERWTL
ncbi:hypothetical protein LMG27174_04203 [Paraburkholderia rhynchosiae]|uniref:Uncharacterized protein n=1 Tax=Paraburkholderia rhynchosiae TaxID=487049 RepID=A0A6J5BL20_9BURK|nr:hypothetical protein LMG27174_04203 [Paraburkholderia rhynchosiae]